MNAPRKIALLCLALGAAAPARADEHTINVMCKPVAELSKEYRDMTRDEWMVARTMFFVSPDTPVSFPPGDKAMLRDLGDGRVLVVFVDGDEACAPMALSKDAVEALAQVRVGAITHPKGGL